MAQLAVKYGVDISTIWRRLKTMRHIRIISKDKDVVINMDTTYWGRNMGLMVIKDAFRNKIIWYKFVRHETISDYMEGIEWLRSHDFNIYGIVCDGLKGLFQQLSIYRVQMCQFHQTMIVRRYLTNRTELPASRELLQISNMIAHTDKESFVAMLEQWYQRWEGFLKERSLDSKSGCTAYTHRRIRLKRNMP